MANKKFSWTTKKSLAVLIASIVGAILYRLGGWGKPFKSWQRDWLIPPLAYGLLYFLSPPVNLVGWLMILPAIMLTGFALTTYWDKLFGDVDNFYMHGFMVGLGAFPMFWYGSAWWIILVRAVLLGAFMGGLNWIVHKKHIPHSDWIEELSRGFATIVTIPLLLI